MSKKIRSDAVYSFILQTLMFLFSLFGNVYVVRKLSLEHYGVYGVLTAILTVMPIVLTINLREYFSLKVSGINDPAKESSMLGTVNMAVMALCATALLLFFLTPLKNFLPRLLNLDGFHRELYIVLFYFAVYSITANYLAYFMFTKRVKLYALITFFIAYLWCVPIIFVRMNLINIFIVRLLLLAAGTIGCILVFFRFNRNTGLFSRFDFGFFKTSLWFGIGTYIMSLSTVFLDFIDRFMLSALSSRTELAYYNFSLAPFNIFLAFITGTVFLIGAPYINEMHNKNDPRKGELYKIALKKLTLYLLPVMVFFIAFSKQIIILLGKTEYLPVSPTYPILALVYFLMVIVAVPRQEIYVTRQLKVLSTAYAVSLGLNIGLNYFLIKAYGFTGAVWAKLIANGVLLWILAVRSKVFDPFSVSRIKIFKIACVGLLLFLVEYAVSWSLGYDRNRWVLLGLTAVSFFLFYAAYIAVCWKMDVICKEEIRYIKNFLFCWG